MRPLRGSMRSSVRRSWLTAQTAPEPAAMATISVSPRRLDLTVP
jgi:hypothetical protein